MKKGRSADSSGGFTIIEVMVFLIVTGILLISAIRLLGGQQARTAFNQTIRESESQFKTTINEVASGFYPNKGDFNCTVNVSGIPTFSSLGVDNQQGQNEDCIFLGKVVRAGSGGTSYSIHTIVGRRLASGVEVTQLENARPVPLAAFSGDPVGTPDATQTIELPSDMQITKIASVSPTNVVTSIGSFGFLMSLGESVSGDLVSGAQSINLVPLPGSTLTDSDAQFKAAVANMAQADIGSAKAIAVCIRLGGTGGQQGTIVFGSEGRQLSTEVIIGAPPSLYGCPA
jgi:type II secretory pathway pseudopilin PulG